VGVVAERLLDRTVGVARLDRGRGAGRTLRIPGGAQLGFGFLEGRGLGGIRGASAWSW